MLVLKATINQSKSGLKKKKEETKCLGKEGFIAVLKSYSRHMISATILYQFPNSWLLLSCSAELNFDRKRKILKESMVSESLKTGTCQVMNTENLERWL